MEEIYDVESLVAKLKVGKASIRNFIKSGQLRASFVGRKYIVLESDLIAFIKNQRIKGIHEE